MNNYTNTENAIEFIKGAKTCTVSFTNQKHINKIKKLYESNKEDFSYYAENADGSICAKIPLKWIKISNPKRNNRELTEEEKDVLRERIKKMHEAKAAKRNN